uniref:Uncharacterized protein n=1 Tax=viral metagenome TaxID=1070528 RepID=A0A6H1ZZM0_9ZZZZ
MAEDRKIEKPIPILGITQPEEGGQLMHLEGFKEPYQGFPEQSIVNEFRLIKKIIKSPITIFPWRRIIKKWYVKIFLGIIFLFFRKKLRKLADWGLDVFMDIVEPSTSKFQLPPKRYCPFVQELYRILTLGVEREKSPEMKEKIGFLRDFICLILEFDSAYRFRLQDILPEIDLEKVKPNKKDEYFLKMRPDYDFGGRDFGSRKKELDQINEEWTAQRIKQEGIKNQKMNQIRERFEKDLTTLNEEFGVELSTTLIPDRNMLRPMSRITFTDTNKTDEELRKITSEYQKKFKKVQEKHHLTMEDVIQIQEKGISAIMRAKIPDEIIDAEKIEDKGRQDENIK